MPQLLGDFLREAAVLVIVFFPLDSYFRSANGATTQVDQGHLKWVAELSAGLLVAGIMLEKIDFGHMAVRLLDYWVDVLLAVRERLQGGD